MKQKYVKIPCEHETSGLPTRIRCDAHHPLSNVGIVALLQESLSSPNPSVQQVRLNQAIPGIKCPREIDGTVSKLQSEMDTIFMKGFEKMGWTSAEENRLFEICANE